MTYPLDISFPTILRSDHGISLELASSIELELPDDVSVETWKERTVIRGSGLSVRMKICWNDHIIQNDRFMELMGRAVSKSRLWAQLLFSVSLQLPGAPDAPEDIILELTRTDIHNAAWSPSAVEGQIATHFPTACLSRLSLTALFSSTSKSYEGVSETHMGAILELRILDTQTPGLRDGYLHSTRGHFAGKIAASQSRRKGQSPLDLLSLLDSALSSLLTQYLAPAAPCIFSPGYLESLWHSTQQIPSISESFSHVQKITMSMELKKNISNLTSNYPWGVESALWRVAKSRVDLHAQNTGFDSLLSWGAGAEEFLHAISQSFDLSKHLGQGEETNEFDLLCQTQESFLPLYNENFDFHKIILEQEGPAIPADDVLNPSQREVWWLQDSSNTLEMCPLSARGLDIHHELIQLELEGEIVGQTLLSLSENTTADYREEEMLL